MEWIRSKLRDSQTELTKLNGMNSIKIRVLCLQWSSEMQFYKKISFAKCSMNTLWETERDSEQIVLIYRKSLIAHLQSPDLRKKIAIQ
ncbi:hypothetical protein NH340_JMT02772 [Sarcoptes scabiei]|nr:hypothetical protein NH340_JMT02772 [Sarcoptes scabiei]